MRRRQAPYTASTTGTAGRAGGDVGRSGDTEGPLPCPDPLPPAALGLRVLEDPPLFLRDAPTTCAVSTQRSGVSGMRHICVFPSQDVRLFTPLHVLVLDTTTNRTRHRRELSVDAVGESLPWHDPDAYTQLPLPLPTRRWQYLGLAAAAALGMPQHIPAGLIAPPVNISARWAGAAGQLRVSWQPPLADYPNFFLYEVCYHPMTPTVTPRGTAPGDLPARPTGRAHPPTARGAAASQGTGQVRTGAVGSGPRGSPPPSPLSLGAGAGRHVGGSPGAAAGGEVPHPGAQQARRHLYGWCLGALVGGGGRRDAPLFW